MKYITLNPDLVVSTSHLSYGQLYHLNLQIKTLLMNQKDFSQLYYAKTQWNNAL